MHWQSVRPRCECWVVVAGEPCRALMSSRVAGREEGQVRKMRNRLSCHCILEEVPLEEHIRRRDCSIASGLVVDQAEEHIPAALVSMMAVVLEEGRTALSPRCLEISSEPS